ncbi:Beta-transaminase [Pleurostoma richardsiae]|uniref:Beta-transaminase n=1 Tax=Pleurostoma richardsiae TaxID=41990 RepID=A0AA38VG37_9PEZI|nr:Beta-transaminase [Pleurostoma richardsiae]
MENSTGLKGAFQLASDAFARANPKSAEINKASLDSVPGGTTRNVVYMKPFPVVMASGDDAYLTDVDGHRYLDLCGEYSAGLFGHSHPVIRKAMHDAIDGGFALGSVNAYEGKLGSLICERFPSIEKVRFSNSGTEAVTTCLSLIRAYRGKSTFIVFQGGYHGGLAAFSSEKENNMAQSSTKTMNVPHKFVVAPYNDVAAMQALVDEHKDNLAAIVLELMQGSSGCIPADVPFIKACREKATKSGAVLLFDEVMTSRMSVGGYQSVLGIYPDMTTLGKYIAGGGCNFGAFGGKKEIMDLLEPGRPGGVYHSGTYNNNVVTMATATATLEQVWTPEAARELWDKGVWLREELNKLSTKMGSTLHVSGTGSLMTIHFTGKVVRNSADAQAGNAVLKELFFLDMLKKGFFMARRGMISLMTVQTREQLSTFVEAVMEFIEERKEYASLPN